MTAMPPQGDPPGSEDIVELVMAMEWRYVGYDATFDRILQDRSLSPDQQEARIRELARQDRARRISGRG
jgi:hypothetical protein